MRLGIHCALIPVSKIQVRRFRDTVPHFPVSEFPSFQGPSVGPRKDHTFQIPRFHVRRFQDTPPQHPDSNIPSVQIPGYCYANSRFRVSDFPRPPLGPVWRTTKFQIPSFRVSEGPSWVQAQIGSPDLPDISQFPSFRGPLLGPSPRDPQLPDSEFPSFRGPLLGPSPRDPQIPSFRVSEDPRLGSQQVRDPQISECRYT